MLIIPGIIASSYPRASTAFESIATATGTGSSGTITFSSIPSTYKHLQIRWLGKTVRTDVAACINLQIQFNSDTGAGSTNYDMHALYGDGSSANTANNISSNSVVFADSLPTSHSTLTDRMGVGILDIHDYASTSKNKTLRGFYGADANIASTNYQINLRSGLWRSTAAISGITLTLPSGSFTTTTTFALYGIKG